MGFTITGSPSQQALARKAVGACDYPFARLARDVTIAWRDLSAEGAYGLYWPGRYLVEVDTGIEVRPLLAQQVTIAEVWHAVDEQAVTDAMRAQVIAAYHAMPDQHQWYTESDAEYRALVGEAMMFGFSAAFAPSLGVSGLEAQFTHRVTPALAVQVRAILLGDTPPPPADSHAEADAVFAAELRRWLARSPFFYTSLQSAARTWLADPTGL